MSSTKQHRLRPTTLVWLNSTIDENDPHYEHTLQGLHAICHDITVFQDIDECIQYLHLIYEEKAIVLTSEVVRHEFVQQIHSLSQVDAIYIYSSDTTLENESWTSKWSKVKGVYDCIKLIVQTLQKTIRSCVVEDGFSSISFVSSDEISPTIDLNRLEPLFMYTKLFKNILLDMSYSQQSRADLLNYCRKIYAGNSYQLEIIDEFERDYSADKAVWWYTRACFIYEFTNQALRLLETEMIVTMGFFIHDLHRQLDRLHKVQINEYHDMPRRLYRGQGLSMNDFEKLRKTQGGLMSFNNFLSTSNDRDVSFIFADSASMKENTVGILFVINIDPQITSTPFAQIKDHTYFDAEAEVLFSMHSIFRIGEVRSMNEEEKLFEVELTLTGDDDPELSMLTDRIEQQVGNGTGWQRLGNLLIQVRHIDQAEKLYLTLLEHPQTQREQGLYYHQLGLIKAMQGDYQVAQRYHEQALSINEKILSPTDPNLATSYHNVGTIYSNMAKNSTALIYFEKALSIKEKTLPINHSDLATSYNNIGILYNNMGKYMEALIYYEKALFILEKILPANHPNLASTCNNIGTVYHQMAEHSIALSYFQKTLSIREKTLPADHPDLASSYNNIGMAYDSMKNSSKALSYYEKSLSIREKIFLHGHPDVATSHNNIGVAYYAMGNHSKALTHYQKALAIRRNLSPSNHPAVAACCNNIGMVYTQMEQYSNALSHYEKALYINEEILGADHPELATCYNNIAVTYYFMKDYHKALPLFRKTLCILQRVLPSTHPHILSTLNWIKLIEEQR